MDINNYLIGLNGQAYYLNEKDDFFKYTPLEVIARIVFLTFISLGDDGRDRKSFEFSLLNEKKNEILGLKNVNKFFKKNYYFLFKQALNFNYVDPAEISQLKLAVSLDFCQDSNNPLLLSDFLSTGELKDFKFLIRDADIVSRKVLSTQDMDAMLTIFEKNCFSYKDGLYYESSLLYLYLVKGNFEKAADSEDYTLIQALEMASSYGRLNLFSNIINLENSSLKEKILTVLSKNYKKILYTAICHNHRPLVELFLMNEAILTYEKDYTQEPLEIVLTSIANKQEDIYQKLIHSDLLKNDPLVKIIFNFSFELLSQIVESSTDMKSFIQNASAKGAVELIAALLKTANDESIYLFEKYIKWALSSPSDQVLEYIKNNYSKEAKTFLKIYDYETQIFKSKVLNNL